MDLGKWLDMQGRGGKARIHREAGVSYDTIARAVNKELRRSGETSAANRISEATGGAVRPSEMLELELPESLEPERSSAADLS